LRLYDGLTPRFTSVRQSDLTRYFKPERFGIDTAGAKLVAEQGPDPTRWRADATAERLSFGFLPKTARWTNRPTFQQVVTFTGHRPR
jgi:hypothetical protein